MKPVWKMGKVEAAAFGTFWLALGVVLAMVDFNDLSLVVLVLFIATGIYVWRVYYLVSRDRRNAQLSYGDYTHHIHQEPAQPSQPVNKLYIPTSLKSPNQPR